MKVVLVTGQMSIRVYGSPLRTPCRWQNFPRLMNGRALALSHVTQGLLHLSHVTQGLLHLTQEGHSCGELFQEQYFLHWVIIV